MSVCSKVDMKTTFLEAARTLVEAACGNLDKDATNTAIDSVTAILLNARQSNT